MFTLILTIHLAGATILALAGLLAIWNMARNATTTYSKLAISLAVGTAAQVATGVGLIMVSTSTMGWLAFCSRIAVYFGILAVLEVALYIKAKQAGTTFPAIKVASTVLAGLAITIVGY